jgi:translocation and assembly module TamA
MKALAFALLLACSAAAHADIKVSIDGVGGDAGANVLTFLSVERYRERDDVDEDTMRRLFNRIDGEVKSALRPFGYYQPEVKADYHATGRDWQVSIAINPGEPVRIRQLDISIEGPGADDPVFDNIRNQSLLRVGMRLHHGAYEQVKGEMTRLAAANGYLAAKMATPPVMSVDVEQHAATVALALDTGPLYRFGNVEIDQKVIRPELMQRFLRFREGDPFSASEVLRTQFALDDSLFFSRVDVERLPEDPETLTVPIRITATKSRPSLQLGAGYGTDTDIRGTLTWTDARINDRGHRFRFEIKASATKRQVNSRYDIPIGDPALERMSLEFENIYEEPSDIQTTTTTLRPSVTRVHGRWQTVTSLAATRTTTEEGVGEFTSHLLVPGIAIASVPKDFLGEAQFSRTFYGELSGSHAALGSDSNFLRLLLQSERSFDLDYRWHLLLRGEAGAVLTSDFNDVPGIYRFFAGGDRSVRGFGYQRLSPEELVTKPDGTQELDKTGGRYLLVGSVELVRDLPWNLAAATFFDAGNAFNDPKDPLAYSAGVGMRYRLPGLSIGLDIAKPMSTGGDLRLHLNITPKL